MGLNCKLDMMATNSWDSLKSLFEALNSSVDYCVLRNFDNLPTEIIEDDVDILVSDFQKFISVSGARKITKRESGWAITIGDRDIRFDVRTPNDQYYDFGWAQVILSQRVMMKGIFIPDSENFNYSLLYHILIHKKYIDRKYFTFLSNEFYIKCDRESGVIDGVELAELLKKLDKFLVENRYLSSIPHERGYYLIMNLENLRSLTFFDDRPKKHRLFYFFVCFYRRNLALRSVYEKIAGKWVKNYLRARLFDFE